MYYSSASGELNQPMPVVLVLTTLFLALAVEFIPLPSFAVAYKPNLPLLALVYWVVYQPRIINYAAAILIGIILDLINQAPLGFNAMSCVTAVLFTNIFRNRFLLLVGVAQALHVFIVLGMAQLALYFLSYLESESSQPPLDFWLFRPSATSAALWLVLPIIMRSLRNLLSSRRGHHADY